ncbi:MAG: protein kinase domain-containing protein, partial [Planctomycetota bacterium]
MSVPERSLGPYRIVREVGRGGMGVVFEVEREDLGKRFALKALATRDVGDETALTRFIREAKALAKIDRHPNIVTVFDVGMSEKEEEGPVHYFTMELVEGGALDGRLDEETMGLREGVEVVEQVARALSHAHKHGVIHRDIKPGNILLADSGEPKITDFGLARDMTSATRVTTTGTAMGTPVYMSPEQAVGNVEEVDEQSDVYSAGAVLYEVLAGLPPFDGPTVAGVIFQVLHREPPRPRLLNQEVPRELEAICLKAMEKEKSRRYLTAAEFADDIERWLSGRPVLAKAPGPLTFAWKRVKRNRSIFLVGAVSLLLVAVASIFAVRALLDSRDVRRRETERAEMRRNALRHIEEGRKKLEQADRYRYMHVVELMEARGLLEEAEKAFGAAVEADEECAEAYHLRGRTRFLQMRYEAAEKDLDRAVELDPEGAPSRVLRGEVRALRALNLRGGFVMAGKAIALGGSPRMTEPRIVILPDNEAAKAMREAASRDLAKAARIISEEKRLARLRAQRAFLDLTREE